MHLNSENEIDNTLITSLTFTICFAFFIFRPKIYLQPYSYSSNQLMFYEIILLKLEGMKMKDIVMKFMKARSLYSTTLIKLT